VTSQAITTLSKKVGIRAACTAVGVAQAGYYRRNRVTPAPARRAPIAHRDRSQPRALSPRERQGILEVLHSERFVDLAPAEVWATLLDEGVYLGSQSTFYRLLRADSGTGERRRQATHPAAVKPELIACRPNEVYSWDITKLHGPAKWTYYYLYVILDIYSRYVVGWMLATRESAVLAEKLIADTAAKQGISRGQLTLHADRGSSMTSKPVAFLLADLGVTQSHSRPHMSNDNPFSEAQFKTLKYRPDFPKKFGSIEAARAYCQRFFTWYNDVHRHGGLGLHTPTDVHHGHAGAVREQRAVHPVGGLPRASRAVRQQATGAAEAPHKLLDQPARRDGGHRSVRTANRCLIQVDRFRTPEASSRPFLRWQTAPLVLLPAPLVTPRGRPIASSRKHECPAKGRRSRPWHPRMASQINPEICRIVELANARMSAAMSVRSCSVRDRA
jgi:putative transposase